jgi:hypothetical protein
VTRRNRCKQRVDGQRDILMLLKHTEINLKEQIIRKKKTIDVESIENDKKCKKMGEKACSLISSQVFE